MTDRGIIRLVLAVIAAVMLIQVAEAAAECNGKERMRATCRELNEHNNKLAVNVGLADPNTQLEVFLDDVRVGEINTNSRGKGKLRLTNVADGVHVVRVCDVVREVTCGS